LTVSDEVRVEIHTDKDVVTAREQGRAIAAGLGFSSVDLTLIVTAISEVARNIVLYADHGEMLISEVQDSTRKGISVVATDSGPGIPDIGKAMQDSYSTGNGLGLGLPGSRRLMDDFEIESKVGQGTTVRMAKWRPRD
jgi:serine/threonine-protein kinase RsbT